MTSAAFTLSALESADSRGRTAVCQRHREGRQVSGRPARPLGQRHARAIDGRRPRATYLTIRLRSATS